MKVIFHNAFYQTYTSDPAAAKGRMEAVVDTIAEKAEFVDAEAATAEQIAAVHSASLIREVTIWGSMGLPLYQQEGQFNRPALGSMSHASA